MTPTVLLVAIVGFAGLVLVLGEVPALRRRPLATRLAPYVPGAHGERPTPGSGRPVGAGPVVRAAGDRLAGWLGVPEPPATRLRRIHAVDGAIGFRVRQARRCALAFGLGTLVATAVEAPAVVAILFVVGSPLLAFVLTEHHLAARSRRWQRRVGVELPVTAEQLGMLLGAGWSLGGALARLAHHTDGAVARDLRRVVGRVQQGLTEVEALREWSDVANVAAVDRLVSVLALHHDTADLARLVSEEARSIRRERHRELIEAIERSNQQVWIPVTVAALVPGTLLLGVPFVDALSVFAST